MTLVKGNSDMCSWPLHQCVFILSGFILVITNHPLLSVWGDHIMQFTFVFICFQQSARLCATDWKQTSRRVWTFCVSLFFRGAGMAQWWERSPPTNVALVRFPEREFICGLSLLLVLFLVSRVFLRVRRFSSLLKKPTLQIPIRFHALYNVL